MEQLLRYLRQLYETLISIRPLTFVQATVRISLGAVHAGAVEWRW